MPSCQRSHAGCANKKEMSCIHVVHLQSSADRGFSDLFLGGVTRGALLVSHAKVFRLAAAASLLRLPRALPPAHRAYRPRLEVEHLARWTPQLA